MPQNLSCLLGLLLAVGSALVAIPSQAQTAANSNKDITKSSQSAIANDAVKTSNLSDSSSLNQDKATNISQSQPEDSSTTNIQKPERTRIPVYSRIGFGLSQ
ncbi:hypothetical protein IQ247_01940 [Plectonema cf. radiosum LEGE 06105]|uniref:Uncharacterized protein n=1 Tax=Plectonema cf. radiosum LEGE 06105 TaxID=945769 RepID=A0A8J7F599_9CYAN|nr:hypothetical protein [Plectonema radiosum]MBE9211489.1 hypothetical protein [Plectonema cf. radiosum LEGE 06105]